MSADLQHEQDLNYLERAVMLAKRGYGAVSPNPYVGALLVKNNQVIGEGFHRRAGAPHAEVAAVADAKKRGNSVAGATLYITLEPCCIYGRTPPCTELIIQEQIARVVTAADDPNPKVAGRGHQQLQAAGIEVSANVAPTLVDDLLKVFRVNQLKKRPFVTLKAALSLDGKLATQSGDSQWITGEKARKYAHYLRGLSDAILIGKGTLLADNPTLNVRYGYSTPAPHRLLLVQNFTGITLDFTLFDTTIAPTTILYPKDIAVEKSLKESLEAAGVTLAALPKVEPKEVLTYAYKVGLYSLFIEGGAQIYNAFIEAGLVDEYALFYGPRLIGNPNALELWSESSITNLSEAPFVVIEQLLPLGESYFVQARRR